MTYSFKEMAAILKMAKAMANADGKVTPEELAFIVNELKNFGAISQIKQIEDAGDKMEPSEAFAILSSLSALQKKYACAYLGTICAIDGNIDDKEVAMWSLISSLSGFPTMSIIDAIKFWKEN